MVPLISSLTALFRGWQAALLLVAVACASPGRAAAECGDHVVILTNPTNQDGHATPATADVPPKAPCSGPNCSRPPERPAPPLAPVSVSGPHGKEAAPLLGAVEPPDLAPSSRAADLTSPRPIRRATSVFHPPRAG